MAMSEPELTAEALTDIRRIPAADWDACAGAANPFLRHAFLAALEESGCVRAETGWLPQHLVIRDEGGRIAAAMPLYLKSHSFGEYVFDHAWAEAYERAGGRYYPKLLSAIPFTPVTGPRLLVRAGEDAAKRRGQLLAAATALARRHSVSSLHVNFLPAAEARAAEAAGFLLRTDQQFHWLNRGYDSFEAFLGSLASRKRKQIRKERRDALGDDIAIRWLQGREITEAVWDDFYAFYQDTGMRKWGRPYLNRAFFSLLGERMGDAVLLVLCRRAGRNIAGALNLVGADTIYGRYWGCLKDHRFLHFEACYYQAIDYAIMHGLARVEAGAQGPHKLARGYQPTTTYSVHWLADPGFSEAVRRYLEMERGDVTAAARLLARHTPFRKDGKDP